MRPFEYLVKPKSQLSQSLACLQGVEQQSGDDVGTEMLLGIGQGVVDILGMPVTCWEDIIDRMGNCCAMTGPRGVLLEVIHGLWSMWGGG